MKKYRFVNSLPRSGSTLICNLLFSKFDTINDTVNFPDGYDMAMEWSLSELMLPAAGRSDQALIEMVRSNAKRFVSAVKGTNMTPLQTVQFDSALTANTRVRDAGWIMHGGFG